MSQEKLVVMKLVHKHLWHYAVYAVIFGGGLVLLLTVHTVFMQELAVIFIALMYVIWSLVHHYVHETLSYKVFFDYLLVAILGILLAVFLFGAA